MWESPIPLARNSSMDSATCIGSGRGCERRSWTPACLRLGNRYLNPFPGSTVTGGPPWVGGNMGQKNNALTPKRQNASLLGI